MWTLILLIGAFICAISALVVGFVSLSVSQRHLSKCSRKYWENEISDQITELKKTQRDIETEWDNMYDKFRQMLGRADRRLKRGGKQDGDGQAVLEPGMTEEQARLAVWNRARQMGIVK